MEDNCEIFVENVTKTFGDQEVLKTVCVKCECDGFLSFAKITENTVLEIKNIRFVLDNLLKDHKPARQFREGTAFVFLLTIADFRRYCYVANGKILLHKKIRGRLHCARSIALRTVSVFA